MEYANLDRTDMLEELREQRATIAELTKSEGSTLERARRAERQFAEMESVNVELEEAAARRELEVAEMRAAFIHEPGSKAAIATLTQQLDDQRRLAHVYQTERDEARVESVAILGALEEWGRWPDLPGVPYGAELVNADTGEIKQIVFHADQIKNLSRAIMVHVQKMRESAWGMDAIKSHYAIDGLRTLLREVREELHQERMAHDKLKEEHA